MTVSYKPAGYNSVSPYLVLKDAAATIEFLQQVFAASELFKLQDAQGRILHAEYRVDDSVIMLADGGPEWPAQEVNIHVYVPDVDVSYQKALDAGASSIQAPVKKEDADKRCGVKDLGGATWWLGTHMASRE